MPLISFEGPSGLDEHIFNTWQSPWGIPYVGIGDRMHFAPVDDAVCCGPGAFVTTADPLERGYNAWFGAPGYYVDAPFVDRLPDEPRQDLMYSRNSPDIGANPWDWLYGPMGTYGHNHGIGVRDWPSQEGEYSLS